MVLLLLSTLAGFAALLIWNVVWVFWLLGIGLIAAGIGIGSDNRKRDRRFKTGFKGNAEDTSDVATGLKLAAIGACVCAIGFFARELIFWLKEASVSSMTWIELYGGPISLAMLLLLVVFAIAKRMRLSKASPAKLMAASQEAEANTTVEPLQGGLDSRVQQDVIRVLFYVGKADGQLRANERSIIESTLRDLGIGVSGAESSVDALLTSNEKPTLHAFKLAVGRLSQQESSIGSAVISAAAKIVATQKAVQDAEQEALDYIQKRLVRPSR